MLELENDKLVEFLSNGYSIAEISVLTGVNNRTLEARLIKLKSITGSKNTPHLVANYLRKGIIK
jgi:DNA-binding CsgD family transcriptional regulator